VKEAARILRVSPSSIYRAVERGTLPSVRLSATGVIRIPASAIDPEPRP
jgi:excisionase family DNA binding protein